MTHEKRITVSMPCYLRAKGTIRAINCIAAQTIDDWEALVVGDGCPILHDFIASNYFADIQAECAKRGNILDISNNPINRGGHGFHITNTNIQKAAGKHFVFYANDDIILPDHFDNYLSAIEGTDYDFVYFNSFVNPNKTIRDAQLQYGMIGHSELIIKTDFLRCMPKHDEHYGHDWQLISTMASVGKYKKADAGHPPTYHVMSLSDNREQGID